MRPQPTETPATLRDVIEVKAALSRLLAEETAHMDRMQLSQIGALQERKLKLTGLLERYTRYLGKHPEAVESASPEDKAELGRASQDFRAVMKQNYDTLLVARAVNRAIVKCVTQAFAARDHNPIYDAQGGARAPAKSVSVTLNETV